VTDPVRSGRQSLRLRLGMADPKVEGSRRVELRLPSVHLGDEFWYALSVFVPADWASDDVPVTVAQWHGAPDTFLLEGHQPPPLRLNVVGDRWLVAKAWDARRWSGPMLRHLEPQGGALLLTAPLDKGRWVDWLFRVRWSYGADGLVEVWKDGALAVLTPTLSYGETLSDGTTRAYLVRARDSVGHLGPGLALRYTGGLGIVDATGVLLKDTVAPGSVVGLRARGTAKGLFLTWTAAVDAGGVAGYRVLKDGRRVATARTAAFSLPASRGAGSWSVQPFDRAGNLGPVSAAVTVAPLANR